MKLRRSVFLVFISVFVLLSFSCSGILGGFGGYNDYFYQQQDKEEVAPPPLVEEEDGSTNGLIFEIIQPNGSLNEELLAELSDEEKTALNSILPFQSGNVSAFLTDMFKYSVTSISIIDNYVPSLYYIEGTWNPIEDSPAEYSASIDNFTVTAPFVVPAENVTMHMYNGFNPLYAVDDNANTQTFGENDEKIVSRFMFYRFKGTASIANLDNYLLAVDTYTKLIFSYAYPSNFDSVGNPTEWASVGRLFYEYDPIGYIQDDGKFCITDEDYIAVLQKKKGKISWSDLTNTGISPYCIGMSASLKSGSYKATVENMGEITATLDDSSSFTLTIPSQDTITGTWEETTIKILDPSAELSATNLTSTGFTLDLTVLNMGITTFELIRDDTDTEDDADTELDLNPSYYSSQIQDVGTLSLQLKINETFSLTIPGNKTIRGTWNGKILTTSDDTELKASNISATGFLLDLTSIQMDKVHFSIPYTLQAGVYEGTETGKGDFKAELDLDGSVTLTIPNEGEAKGTWEDTIVTIPSLDIDFPANDITTTSFSLDLS